MHSLARLWREETPNHRRQPALAALRLDRLRNHRPTSSPLPANQHFSRLTCDRFGEYYPHYPVTDSLCCFCRFSQSEEGFFQGLVDAAIRFTQDQVLIPVEEICANAVE